MKSGEQCLLVPEKKIMVNKKTNRVLNLDF
jgi:hypothetical protein